MTVTEADYARMPWHAKQRLNDTLTAEHRQLVNDIARLGLPAAKVKAHAEDVQRQARRILANLPADPNAAKHRFDLDRALAPRAEA